MPWIDSLDWSSLNALRRYPLREGSSALSDNELFSVPDDFIVDFVLCASSDVKRRFYISKIYNKLTNIVIEVSDDQNTVVGSFEISTAAHTEDSEYYMKETYDYIGANGKITIGSLNGISSQPAGIFTFLQSATEFEPRTVIPGIRGVDRISFNDAFNYRYNLTGDVTLTSRNNMRFSRNPEENEVLWDAGDRLGLNKECYATDCVKSINGVVPDPQTGNISLLGLDCLAISSPREFTVSMEDTCCTPCSGCDDLEDLTTRLTSLENKFIDLKESYQNVNGQLTTYLSTINSNCACPPPNS
jgi:hypothetical protein